ncbi:MAG: hypothetical protein WD669_09310 [Pirellulales bacterium]
MAQPTKSHRYSEWDDAIGKLAAMTEQGAIKWELHESFHGRGEDIAISPAFIAEVNGRNVLLYEYKYKYFTDVDEWTWQTDVAVEFVDDEGRLEYTWQGSRGSRQRLLDAIRYRAAHVDDFFKEFLRESAR